MKVSVVITTKNEEDNIENCLRSIKKQSYSLSLIEIIVVDNNSSDRTQDIARKYTDQVFNRGPERSAQRNFGILQAKGEYILYLDADMTLHKNTIKDAVELVNKNPNVYGVYISEIVTGSSFLSQVRKFEREFYDATVVDCVRFIQRKAFLSTGGFDTSMSGPEDWDLDKKIRAIGEVTLLQTPLYHNEGVITLSTYLRKKAYYARSFDAYIHKWGKDDTDVRKQFSPLYRYIGIFIEDGKWKRILSHPILSLAMLSLRTLVGFIFIVRKRS